MATSDVLRQIFGDDSDDDEHFLDTPATNDEHVSDIIEDATQPSGINGEGDTNVIEIGMQFDSIESLFDSYQEHARSKDFSVVKRTENEKYARFVCDRAGISKANKTSKKVDCKARLNAIKQLDQTWLVSSMENEHNHEIIPEFSPLMAAHRHLSVHMKRQLEANDIAGIRPCKNVRLCEVQSGGPENLGCTTKDCRNFIESRRRLRLGEGDAEAIRKMFARLQIKDRIFFYSIDLDDEGRLRNVMWIHPRSKAAYEEFHDAISFDTTYLVNRYKLPFASIVGVNHHGHSILFGCALLTNEDAESFRWLFTCWLEAMNDVHPNAIITDQCESIKIAIRDVMPNTIHRYCIWHILSKIPQKFKGVRELSRCKNEFKGIVYDSLTIENFETKWGEFLVKYNMENNVWLTSLYNEREKWVPVYLHNHFWAGMISTQRSEGMHAYFDEFVHSRSTLKQFMEQYEIAIGNKIRKEFDADYRSKTRVIFCKSHFKWEEQFQKAYTNSIFARVQDEINQMIYCHVITPSEEEAIDDLNVAGVEKFRVLERDLVNNFYFKEFTYTVEWRPDGAYINCNCKSFEFRGILCCHIMKVMAQKDIRTMHERYLLRRWRKDVYRPHSSIFFVGGYPHMTDEYKKFREVEKYFQECVDIAMDNPTKLDYIKELFIAAQNVLENWNPNHVDHNEDNNVDDSPSSQNGTPILDPRYVVPRGRPRTGGRHISAFELATRGRGNATRGRGNRGGNTGRGNRGGGRGNRGGNATVVRGNATRGRGSRGRGRGDTSGSGVGARASSNSFNLNEDPSEIDEII